MAEKEFLEVGALLGAKTMYERMSAGGQRVIDALEPAAAAAPDVLALAGLNPLYISETSSNPATWTTGPKTGAKRTADGGWTRLQWTGTWVPRGDVLASEGTLRTRLELSRADLITGTLDVGSAKRITADGDFFSVVANNAAPAVDSGIVFQLANGKRAVRLVLGRVQVRWYWDGGVDWTNAIEATTLAVEGRGGGDAELGLGSFQIGGTYHTHPLTPLENWILTARKGVRLIGQGSGTELKLVGGFLQQRNAHLIQGIGVNDFTLSRMVINGNGANNLVPSGQGFQINSIGVRMQNGRNFRAELVAFRDIAGHNCIALGRDPGQEASVANIVACLSINGGPVMSGHVTNPNGGDFSAFYSEWDFTKVPTPFVQQEYPDTSLLFRCGGVELHGTDSDVTGGTFIGCNPAIYLSDRQGVAARNQTSRGNNIRSCLRGIVFACFADGFSGPRIEGGSISLYQSPLGPPPDACIGISYVAGGRTSGGVFSPANGNASALDDLMISGLSIQSEQPETVQAIGLDLHSLHAVRIGQRVTLRNLGGPGVVLRGSAWGDNDVDLDGLTISGVACLPGLPDGLRAGIVLLHYGESAPYADSPARAFAIQAMRLGARNRFENRIEKVVDAGGVTTAIKSVGRMLSAVSVIGLDGTKSVEDLEVHISDVSNVANRLFTSSGAKTLDALHPRARSVPRVRQYSTQTRPYGRVYPRDVEILLDGTRTVAADNAAGWQGAPSGLTYTSVAGSNVVTVSSAAELRPGMLIALPGAGGGAAPYDFFPFIRAIVDLTHIEVEGTASRSTAGGTLIVVAP